MLLGLPDHRDRKALLVPPELLGLPDHQDRQALLAPPGHKDLRVLPALPDHKDHKALLVPPEPLVRRDRKALLGHKGRRVLPALPDHKGRKALLVPPGRKDQPGLELQEHMLISITKARSRTSNLKKQWSSITTA